MIRIAIASGKGGTGKTFISTNLFHTLSGNYERIKLVDCDAEAPNALTFFDVKKQKTHDVIQMVPVIDTDKCTYCGKCHEYCVFNAIFILPSSKVINVIEDLCHGCGACSVACEYDAISEKPVVLGQVTTYTLNGKPSFVEARTKIGVMSPVSVIKEAVEESYDDAEIILMDAPPGTSCPFVQTVTQADYTILVTEPTPFGLSDLKQSVETLRILKKPFGVIINRAGMGNDNVYKYLDREKITLLMEIPFKKEIAEICSTGNIVSGIDKDFAKQLKGVFEKILSTYGDSNNKR